MPTDPDLEDPERLAAVIADDDDSYDADDELSPEFLEIEVVENPPPDEDNIPEKVVP